jgi:hypothetical protein
MGSTSRPYGQQSSVEQSRRQRFAHWLIHENLTGDRIVMDWAIKLYPELSEWAIKMAWFSDLVEEYEREVTP